MKEQFVNYEIALRLKELGFDEECLLNIRWINDCDHETKTPYEPSAWLMGMKEIDYDFSTLKEDFKNEYSVKIKIPTWQQAICFILKSLEIRFPSLEFRIFSDKSGCWYQSEDIYHGTLLKENVDICFDDLCEAVLTGIDLIKK